MAEDAVQAATAAAVDFLGSAAAKPALDDKYGEAAGGSEAQVSSIASGAVEAVKDAAADLVDEAQKVGESVEDKLDVDGVSEQMSTAASGLLGAAAAGGAVQEAQTADAGSPDAGGNEDAAAGLTAALHSAGAAAQQAQMDLSDVAEDSAKAATAAAEDLLGLAGDAVRSAEHSAHLIAEDLQKQMAEAPSAPAAEGAFSGPMRSFFEGLVEGAGLSAAEANALRERFSEDGVASLRDVAGAAEEGEAEWVERFERLGILSQRKHASLWEKMSGVGKAKVIVRVVGGDFQNSQISLWSSTREVELRVGDAAARDAVEGDRFRGGELSAAYETTIAGLQAGVPVTVVLHRGSEQKSGALSVDDEALPRADGSLAYAWPSQTRNCTVELRPSRLKTKRAQLEISVTRCWEGDA